MFQSFRNYQKLKMKSIIILRYFRNPQIFKPAIPNQSKGADIGNRRIVIIIIKNMRYYHRQKFLIYKAADLRKVKILGKHIGGEAPTNYSEYVLRYIE